MTLYRFEGFDRLKALIFDFDETLYFSPTLKRDYVNYVKQTVMDLSGRNEAEAMALLEEYGFTAGGDKRVSFGSCCEKFGIPKEKWDAYRIGRFFQIDYASAVAVDNGLIAGLAGRFRLFLVSNEIEGNLRFKAEKLGIDLAPFSVRAPKPEELKNYRSKAQVYRQIEEELGCGYPAMMAVGGRFHVDIEPLLELGGCGAEVHHPDEIAALFASLFGERRA